MNRCELFVLGTGLVVGEPVRCAYSFLNGFGLDLKKVEYSQADFDIKTARQRMADFIQAELAKQRWARSLGARDPSP